MTWPIDIASVSRAERRLHSDVADLARKSGSLERENAKLRADLRDARQAIETLRTAHAAASTRLLLADRILAQLTTDAARSPLWGLSRYVRFGPVSDDLKSWEQS